MFLIEAEQQGGGEAKAKENETRDVAEDQGRGEKAIRRRFLGGGSIPRVSGQHCVDPLERWEGTNVCRLSGPESIQSQR